MPTAKFVHFITFIDVYFGDRECCRVELKIIYKENFMSHTSIEDALQVQRNAFGIKECASNW